MQGLLMIDMQRAFDNSSCGERNNPQLEVNSQKLLNFFRERVLASTSCSTCIHEYSITFSRISRSRF